MMRRLLTRLRDRLRVEPPLPPGRAAAVREYWTRRNVTQHKRFASAQESLAYFAWRGDQYFGYMEQMPVTGQDGNVVLDYGCGPGHDLVGFGVYSKPRRLIACDVSSSSLEEARERLALHGIACELHLLPEAGGVPLPDASVDYVHCSGVLHHTPDPLAILREFRRVLRPGGRARIMVYNYQSLWLHYYVAYQKMLREQKYRGMEIREAFARTTDGESCPIALVFRPEEFIALAREAGFAARFTGAAVSAFEASLAPQRFGAIMDPRLREESRRFLAALTLDARGLPMIDGAYAGVDACFALEPGAA
jgi:SAM-dependent methyltransferase